MYGLRRSDAYARAHADADADADASYLSRTTDGHPLRARPKHASAYAHADPRERHFQHARFSSDVPSGGSYGAFASV